MRCVPRSFLGLLSAVVFVAVAWALLWERGWLSSRGGPTPLALKAFDEEQAQEEIEEAQKRLRAKREVVVELLAERLTLRQAAARFQELDAGKPESQLAPWRASCPGDTDEERYSWTVLRFVAVEVRHSPEQVRAVRRRVEAELPADLRYRLLEGHRRLGLSGTDSAEVLLEQPSAGPNCR
jgi:hypothetical protein